MLGGRHVQVPRLRVRSADGEVPLVTFEWAAATDPLGEHTLAAVAAGVSTRRYASTLHPVPAEVTERGTSEREAVAWRPDDSTPGGERAGGGGEALPAVRGYRDLPHLVVALDALAPPDGVVADVA